MWSMWYAIAGIIAALIMGAIWWSATSSLTRGIYRRIVLLKTILPNAKQLMPESKFKKSKTSAIIVLCILSFAALIFASFTIYILRGQTAIENFCIIIFGILGIVLESSENKIKKWAEKKSTELTKTQD